MPSFSDQAFLDESSQSEINNDLDYSLVLLNAFPAWSNVLLSGYNAGPLARRQQLVSVSAPQGFFLKAAFSTVLPKFVGQRLRCLSDDGGAHRCRFVRIGNFRQFRKSRRAPKHRIIAVFRSHQNQPALDSCDVNGEFIATYTSFSAIYPSISSYLNQPLDTPSVPLCPLTPVCSRHRPSST